MPYVPKFRHLFKILFRRRDPAAAEGLFLEGSIEYEGGDLESARTMFLFGTQLDPNLAGNFFNLAVVTEKIEGPSSPKTIKAWRDFIDAAARDPRQSPAAVEKVRAHVAALEATAS